MGCKVLLLFPLATDPLPWGGKRAKKGLDRVCLNMLDV